MSAQEQQIEGEPESKTRLRLWLRLLKFSRGIESELRENLRKEFSSTLPRFDVMAALNRNRDGMKMSAISNALMVSNGNVTGIVDRLVSEGFVIRETVPGDRRAMRVRLTAPGQAEFDQQAAAHEAWIDGLLKSFSAENAKEMIKCLEDAGLNETGQGPT
ncbi:MAG: MarR family transcriptional regulator [Rhodobacteraceae bacterium]|nr:MarR family transcriptional regulator [Paracoccaceae bacterium]